MTPSQRRWFGAAALALAVPTGWAWYRLAQHRNDNLDEFHGARLGMTASDLRRAYAHEGSWEARTEGDDVGELILDWQSNGPEADAPVRGARFEFHQGLLVAIRAEIADASEVEAARTEPVVLSPASVYYRAAAPSGTTEGSHGTEPITPRARITILARDCPTHADEVEEVLRLAGR